MTECVNSRPLNHQGRRGGDKGNLSPPEIPMLRKKVGTATLHRATINRGDNSSGSRANETTNNDIKAYKNIKTDRQTDRQTGRQRILRENCTGEYSDREQRALTQMHNRTRPVSHSRFSPTPADSVLTPPGTERSFDVH